MKRKIVQIASYFEGGTQRPKGVVVALADDGSLWRGYIKNSETKEWIWTPVPALPDNVSNLQRQT